MAVAKMVTVEATEVAGAVVAEKAVAADQCGEAVVVETDITLTRQPERASMKNVK